jgi:isopentenyldiphosphate isomerase
MLADVLGKGLFHRVVSVFVQDDQGRMLLQLRGSHVAVYPNCWDQAAGGTVDEGCTYEQTAVQELAEELGLHDVQLKKLGVFKIQDTLHDGRANNQFECTFIAHVPHGVELRKREQEVAKLQWFRPDELRALVTERPETCAPGFLHALRQYFPED